MIIVWSNIILLYLLGQDEDQFENLPINLLQEPVWLDNLNNSLRVPDFGKCQLLVLTYLFIYFKWILNICCIVCYE